jgi:hypothetical protein
MQRAWLVMAGLIGLATFILEMVYRPAHPYSMWHTWPIFDLIFGALGSVALVFGAKWLGHHWLQRKANYYGDDS